jgi:copper chaperone CopZ
MKTLMFCLLIIVSKSTNAQFTKATLQASGLTCSMCNKSIHKALASLAYVEKITPDLNTNSFEIVFKDSSLIQIDDLKQKVEQAGYKVASLLVEAKFNNLAVEKDAHIQIDSINYHFVNVTNKTLNGVVNLKIIDKGFITAKEHKKYSKLTNMSCYQTGVMEACCTKSTAKAARIYHITF